MNEEFKDSLELIVAQHENSNDMKGELFDTVEQDSLEIIKNAANETNGSELHTVSQFLPFAQIGTNWSTDCAAQKSTSQPNSITNQIVEIESNDQTNKIALQTNNISSINLSDTQNLGDVPGTEHILITNTLVQNKFSIILSQKN